MMVQLMLFGIVSIALGASMLKWPRAFWYISHGWAVDESAKPSDGYLVFIALNAAWAIILGLILTIAGLIGMLLGSR
jgi:hypothetical protein